MMNPARIVGAVNTTRSAPPTEQTSPPMRKETPVATSRTMYNFVALALVTGLSACVKEGPQQTPTDLVARGQYLVTIGACHDCHSRKS